MASVWSCLKRNQFSVVVLLLQSAFLVLFGVFVDYTNLALPPQNVRNETFEANSSAPKIDDDKSVAEQHAKEAKSSILESYAGAQLGVILNRPRIERFAHTEI